MSKDSNRVAIAYIVDSKEDLLVGKRNDNDKFTTPAGHIMVNECPHMGMCRELKEETGLTVQSMKLIKVGKKEVTIDFNPPLAGKDLNFKLKRVE